MEDRHVLSDVESQLLLRFESRPSLEGLAEILGRDPTVISKQLKRISEKTDFLMKVSGRWNLTPNGRAFNLLTSDFLHAQRSLLNQKKALRIGANREFSSRIIGRNYESLLEMLPGVDFSIASRDVGIEEALLLGEIDLGFECGRPLSPEIVYRHEAVEDIVAVASIGFMKTQDLGKKGAFEGAPHIHCERLKADRVTKGKWVGSNIAIRTNDIATARELCVHGAGWALLPLYCIRDELKDQRLKTIDEQRFQEQYGVWMVRNRAGLATEFESLRQWLRGVRL